MTKPKKSTLAIIVSVFLLLLVVRFPFQNLKGLIFGKIFKATGIYIIADDIYPSFFGWPGVGMRNVSITIPIGQSEMDLECEKLTFRVGIAGLFPPTPSASLYMKGLKKGGNIYLKFSQNKQGIRAAVETYRLDLSQLSPTPAYPIATGQANIDASLQLNNTNAALTTGDADIHFTNLVLSSQNLQGIVLAEMKLGKINGELNIKAGTANIESFQIGDSKSDIQGSMSGDIRLDPDWNNSQMNLGLKLKLSEGYMKNPDAATITSFLNTFKLSEGEYSVRLNATIAQFIQSSILLLQKGN